MWHKNAFESFLTRWMNLEPVIQCEVIQKEKHKYGILTHNICNLERWYWWTYLQGRNGDSDRDNRFVDTVGEQAFAVVVQLLSRVWLFDPMDCRTPGFAVLHYLPGEGDSGSNWESSLETYTIPYVRHIASMDLFYDLGSSNLCSVTT